MSVEYVLSKYKQKLFLKNFEISYRNKEVPPPHFVFWDSTRKCNLNCIHCGAKNRYEKELNTNEIKDIIDQLVNSGVKILLITGGEPLVRNDFFDVLKYASKKGLHCGFATNGYLINKNNVNIISKTKTSTVQISIDGAEQIHNKIRRDNRSFKKAINAIKLLKKYTNCSVGVSTVVTPKNIECLNELKRIFLSLNIDFWNIGTVMPIGNAKDNAELFLSNEQVRRLMKFISSSKHEINVDFAENFPFLGKYDKQVRKKPKICPVGFLSCCIGVDGHIRGCPDQPDTEYFREGNVLKERFGTIWTKSFKKYRDREIFKIDKKCSSCKEKYNCYGGCWVMRERALHCILHYC